jgi:crotonobetainyl-CoA:carnitine CoA-transferase CaiB-like acyl-CoA transferase
MAKALEGVRVLDFTQYLSGPVGTAVLSELGAEIIKVEMPGKGEPERLAMPFTPKRESYQFLSYNRGKKSVTLNLKNPKGLEIARTLAAKADVLVENFASGVMERLGLGYEEVSKINPRIIYASISGFGHTGPRRNDVSYDIVAQAMGGLMSVTGRPDGEPTRAGVALGDYMGGYNGVIAILAALYYRTISGEGQAIDISMQDSIWSMVFPDRANFFDTRIVPKRQGNRLPTSAPFGTFNAKDGYVVICTITDPQWQKVLQAIGREDLIGDPRYATRENRTQNMDEVDALVGGWCQERTVEQAISALKEYQVPCSSLPTFDQVANDPHLLSREMLVEVDQPVSGKVKLIGSVYKMSRTPGDRRMIVAAAGQHNEEIYCGLLGIGAQEMQQLEHEGVI